MFEPIIGLEIHVELKTKSKMFCGCPADFFGKEPNAHCCPVCLGLPGALPVPNRKAVEWCVMLGMALDCQIPELSKFDRKNYFYPDLPKGYQISQYDQPFCVNGKLKITQPDGKEKIIRIRRVHLEEDTGKLMHVEIEGKKSTLVDFNRSGVPLVEIVTEPDIRSSEEARIFLKKLHQIIRYLQISDTDMEKGSMRLEPNISLREVKSQKSPALPAGSAGQAKVKSNNEFPKYKVEVKNINSFAFAKKAIDFEIKRQSELLCKGETPLQETRGWNEKQQMTTSQRSKEEAHDYRYFPEPDIPPIRWNKEKLNELRENLPALPDDIIEKLIKTYKLSLYDSTIIADNLTMVDYFEKCVSLAINIPAKIIANWLINKKIDIKNLSPEDLVKKIAQSQQDSHITDEELHEIIRNVIQNYPKAVSDYKSGKESALMFLTGIVMKEVKNSSLVDRIKQIIKEELS